MYLKNHYSNLRLLNLQKFFLLKLILETLLAKNNSYTKSAKRKNRVFFLVQAGEKNLGNVFGEK